VSTNVVFVMMVQQLSTSSLNANLIVQHVYHLGCIKFISTPVLAIFFVSKIFS
jgi:hypothetical protein